MSELRKDPVTGRWVIGDGHTIAIDPKTGLARGANDRRSAGSGVAVP